MSHALEMLRTHPQPGSLDPALLAECLDACLDCGQACTACADACLAEEHVASLTRCIRLNFDCADVCHATARLLSRPAEADLMLWARQVEACLTACRACGHECRRHAHHHEHCAVCADACHTCETACDALLATLGTAS